MTDLTRAQDPGELFDLSTVDGVATGEVKRRADVHRDGDWHRAIHVWVVGIDEHGPFLTFQRRSMAKDTSPGKLDATVGGHVRAGEGLEQTLREVEEEIGIVVAMSQLRAIGTRICVNDREPGIKDHELQDVFLLRDDRPLTTFRPNPMELAGLVRFPLDRLLAYLAGDEATVSAQSIGTDESTLSPVVVSNDELRMQIDRYVYRVAIAADLFLSGAHHISV